MSARNLTALGLSVGMGVISGVYIFKPTLQEQNEFWRNPGQAKTSNATDGVSLSQRDQKDQPPNRTVQGQEK